MKFIIASALLFSFTNLFSQSKDLELADYYYYEGAYDKAIANYSNLANVSSNIKVIHDNYFKALLKEKSYKICKGYFKKILKWFPDNPKYNVDYGVYLNTIGKVDKAQEHYETYLNTISSNPILLNPAGQYFVKYRYYDYADKAYKLGLEIYPVVFGLELANLYKIQNKTDIALKTYLDILRIRPNEITIVQNNLTSYLGTEAEVRLEKMLFQNINKTNQLVFNQLLAWLYIQKKEFYKAFIQSKSIDKRRRLGGKKLLDLAKITTDSKMYDLSAEILNYVIKQYPRIPQVYYSASKELIRVQELRIKNTFPIDLEKIREIVASYEKIIAQKIRHQGQYNVSEEKINLAKLHAFYLDEKDIAIELLKEVIAIPFPKYRPLAMLTLADIYILIDETWEASLIYLKIQKAYKGSSEANLAKLQNAKVQYFKGNFKLAKDYLDIIKAATTRKTANDAIQLSMFIDDNSGLDTTDILLQRFAGIELLAYQNKFEATLEAFEELLIDCRNHPLADDILWQQAKILRKLGRFEAAIEKLKTITEKHAAEILADDANFTIALIYEENLKQTDQAKSFYKKQLLDFKDSWYSSEARQRYRNLN